MKIFCFHDADKDEQFAQLKKEINTIEALHINGIPKIYDLVPNAMWKMANGQECPVSYMLMELIKGVELMDFLF